MAGVAQFDLVNGIISDTQSLNQISRLCSAPATGAPPMPVNKSG